MLKVYMEERRESERALANAIDGVAGKGGERAPPHPSFVPPTNGGVVLSPPPH